jgi:hypothetical protein
MKATIDALKEAGLRGKVTNMVGGAPLPQNSARRDWRRKLCPGRRLGSGPACQARPPLRRKPEDLALAAVHIV